MRIGGKKGIVSLVLVFSLVLVNPVVSLAAASAEEEHVHELSSIPLLECVLWEEIVKSFYYTDIYGKTYLHEEVSQYCRFYHGCYCGYRTNYFNEGRRIERDIPVL